MRPFVFLLFSLSLFAFEGQKVYECVPKYRIVNGAPHEFSLEEQKNNHFQVIFNQQLNKLKTSDGMLYSQHSSNLKGKLYVNSKKINGRMLNYKLKLAGENGMYRSVYVTGYGNLVNEYVLCHTVKENSDIKE